MKYLLLMLIISIGFTSCITEQKCDRRYPPKIIVKDSIVYNYNTLYKDTTITLYLPGDTVYQDSIVYVIKDKLTGLINSDSVIVSTEFATAIAWVEGSILKQVLIQHDIIVNQRIDSAVRVTTERIEKYHSEVILEPVYLVHWYDKIARWLAIIVILVALGWGIIKRTKIYLKTIKPF